MSEENDLSTEVVEDVEQPIEQPEAPVEKTMDDTIRETLHKIQGRESETEEQKAERLRDEKGRFATKDAAQAPDQQAEPQAPEPTPEPVAAPVTVPPELQKLGLRKEEAEAISANPVALQAFMRRSEEMHKGLEQYRQKAQFADQVSQAIQPFSQRFQMMGKHPIQAVQELLKADQILSSGTPEQKQAAALHLLQGYGIQIGEGQQPYVDQNLSAVQSQLQQLQGWILQRNQQEQQREQEQLNSEISRFSADPANKHFEAVRADMAALLQAGVATDLKDAYEKAIYANPQVRALILAEQQAQSEAQRKAEAAQRAQEAKKASAVNIPKKGSLPAKKPLGSMEDTIRDKARELGLIG